MRPLMNATPNHLLNNADFKSNYGFPGYKFRYFIFYKQLNYNCHRNK